LTGSIAFRFVARRAWWRKAAHLIDSRREGGRGEREREREREREQEIKHTLKCMPLETYFLQPTKPQLLVSTISTMPSHCETISGLIH
jgi:hypothetical protein